MLKSKDAFVPCRNMSFGKRFSFTAMEKAATLPLRDWFIPYSPIPMPDVFDWLLLVTRDWLLGAVAPRTNDGRGT
jgi:hypothetical protein